MAKKFLTGSSLNKNKWNDFHKTYVVHTEIVGLHQDLKNVWWKTQEPHEDKLPIDEISQIKESPSELMGSLSQETLNNTLDKTLSSKNSNLITVSSFLCVVTLSCLCAFWFRISDSLDYWHLVKWKENVLLYNPLSLCPRIPVIHSTLDDTLSIFTPYLICCG